jgi:hypothetical protein
MIRNDRERREKVKRDSKK